MSTQMKVFVLLLIVLAGAFVAFQMGASTNRIVYYSWSPRDYQPEPGDCFVPPQGDPLYDAHYAQEVNKPNCEALKLQSEAKNIDADTRRTNTETSTGIFGIVVIGVALVSIAALLFVASNKPPVT